jgi:hypothetical protein
MTWLTWFKKRPKPAPEPRPLMRCGTPYLQSGGIVIAHTGNLAEIIRGDSPKPLTTQTE